jgi:HAD superfamily hydrolase (TIGR01509 family)
VTGAVVFDFDGVLADSERLHYKAFRDVLGHHGWALSERDYFDRYLGFDDAALVSEFARDHRLALAAPAQAAIAQEKAEVYQSRLVANGVLYPGAAEVIARLGAQFRLAIASGSLAAEIRTVLDAAGLAPAFAAVIGADDVARTKPAPDPYLAAVRALGVPASAAVAIEDSRWGLESARAAGLRTIALTTSYPAAALGGADRVFASLDDITVDVVAGLLAPS